MPSLPDVPGKSLIGEMTKRTRTVAAAAGTGALAVGGFVAKRVLDHRGGGDGGPGANADPIAQTPTAPPGAEAKPVPKVEPVKPKAAKPAPAKPKVAKPKPAKPKHAKPKAVPKAKAKAKPTPKGKPAKPKDPHHSLNNPVVDDPDLTEYPDPYDTREDPLDEDHPQTGAESTSEPPLQQDPEVENGGKPPRRDKLDD
jgi:hypothetical protein